MALINGILTNEGLTKLQEAQLNQGWYIFPSTFEVSDSAGVLEATRDFASKLATWYDAPISSRQETPPSIINFICTIPPEQAVSFENINEIYLNAKDGTHAIILTGISGTFVVGEVVTNGSGARGTIRTIDGSTLNVFVTEGTFADTETTTGETSGATGTISGTPAENEFLLAVFQPTQTIVYDKDGSVTLRLPITLQNLLLNSQVIQFLYTQATEILEHDSDPLAHPDIRSALAKHGIFVQTNEITYVGQDTDELASFAAGILTDGSDDGKIAYLDSSGDYDLAIDDGTEKADWIGVMYPSLGIVVGPGNCKMNVEGSPAIASDMYLSSSVAGQVTNTIGNRLIGKFLGTKNLIPNIIVAVPHDNFGIQLAKSNIIENITPDGTLTATGMAAYRKSDGEYGQALADGSSKEKWIGIYDDLRKTVQTHGPAAITHSVTSGDIVYLQAGGTFAATETTVPIGISHGTNLVDLRNDIVVNYNQLIEENVSFEGSVVSYEAVYWNVGNAQWEKGLADGTAKQAVEGLAVVTGANTGHVVKFGSIDTAAKWTGDMDDNAAVFLSSTVEGALTKTKSKRQIGQHRELGNILIGGVGGSGGGDVTFEDLRFGILQYHSDFDSVIYDTLVDPPSVDSGDLTNYWDLTDGTPDPTWDANAGAALNFDGALIFASGGIAKYRALNAYATQYRFMAYADIDTPGNLTVEYTIAAGGASGWTAFVLGDTVLIEAGFTDLWIRFTGTGAAELYNIGAFYDFNLATGTSDILSHEIYTSTGLSAEDIVTLPNGMAYALDGKSLQLTHHDPVGNTSRELIRKDSPATDGLDTFEEISTTTIRVNFAIASGEFLDFKVFYGYVDSSVPNTLRLDLEHDNTGKHLFTDSITSIQYNPDVQDGELVLIPV